MIIKEGGIKHVLKNVSICLILMAENRGLLHYVLYFTTCFIFHMKCFTIFIKKKKSKNGQKMRKWPSSKRKQRLELKIIHYLFNKHLLQFCYVTYFCTGNLKNILFFFFLTHALLITPVLLNSGTLRLLTSTSTQLCFL